MEELMDARSLFLTPNTPTVYVMMHADLKDGPVVLDVPPGVLGPVNDAYFRYVTDGNNLHRNIIFRDGGDKASQIVPFSQYDSFDAEDLWKWMAAYEQKTGGKVLAIPHNGNLSSGLMFDDVTFGSKKPIDKAYAERRMKWEPVYEVTQMKGDGEAASDEFADFETWDKASFGPTPHTPEMFPERICARGLEARPRL
ncbi:MAG TPA: DUF3604 domain-containing protein [Terrimicrobiaceae bacterium]